MQKTVLIALMIVVALGSPLAAREHVADVEFIDETVVRFFPPVERAPGDLCEACNNSYHWTVDGWMTGNESYMSYCDPSNCPCCEAGWKPISVTIYLHWAEENDCQLTLSADIMTIDLTIPECPMPGSVIATSDPLVVGPLGAGLWAVTVPIPIECPVMDEPFFASITFGDDCTALPSLVTDEGPCDPCISWNDWGSGPNDLCDYGFPGNLSMYTTLQCQGPSPVEHRSWGTIKAMYR